MALITIRAVVNVPADSAVVGIRLRFAMTIRALENRIVVGVDVAGRAHAVRIAVIDGERSVLHVVERGLHPIGRVVTTDAGSREELRLRCVPGIAGGHVVRFMASIAVGRQSRVIVVDVAVRTLTRRRGMHAS